MTDICTVEKKIKFLTSEKKIIPEFYFIKNASNALLKLTGIPYTTFFIIGYL